MRDESRDILWDSGGSEMWDDSKNIFRADRDKGGVRIAPRIFFGSSGGS